MEPVIADAARNIEHTAPAGAAGPAHGGRAERRRNTPSRVRMGLVWRAPGVLRRHMARAARRFVVLLVADLATYYLMRALLRAVRDYEVLGTGLADRVGAVLPKSMLDGWQFAAALLVGLLVTGNYRRGDARCNPRTIFAACALAAALPLWMTIWMRGLEVVAVQYALTAGFVGLALVVQRLTLDRLVARVARPELTAPRTLFVGPAEECRDVMASPAFQVAAEFRTVGFVDVHIPPVPGALGHIVDFARLLHEAQAETIVVCGYLTDVRFQDVVDASLAAGCQLLSVPRSVDLAGVVPTLVWRQGQPLIELNAPVVRAPALLVKRVADFVAASVGLVLVAPVFVILAGLVMLDSRGPIFYSSERWGRGGRLLRMWKFRTMVADAAALLENDPRLKAAYDEGVKLRADPRVTRVGRLLRKWSLDELPQLFNVLRGDMSFVGPRPKLFGEETKYGPLFGAVLSVPPGITGLWQVSGRNNLSYEQRVKLDMDYVRRCSLRLDLAILLRTIPVVIRGVGAH